MKHRTLIFAIALSLLSPGGAAGDVTSSDIKTEEGLRVELDRLETRYEAAARKLGESSWQARRPGSSSAATRAARDEAYKELAQIQTDPKLAEIRAYWVNRKTVTHDSTLIRRVVLWNRTHLVAAITLDPKLLAMQEDLAERFESEPFSLDDRGTTRAELQTIINTNPDAALRRKAWVTLAGAPGSTLKNDVGKLIRQRAVQCQPIKEHWFHDLIYHAQDLEPYWIFNTMEVLMKRSDPAWNELLPSLQEALGKQKLQPWDYDYAISKLAEQRGVSKIIATRFKEENAVPAARELLAAMGFDLSKVPLTMEVGPLTFPSLFVPVSVPSDLRAAVTPPHGPADMIPFYEQVFRMHGRAAQSAFNRQEAPMMKGYPWIAGALNAIYAEGMAAGFSEFLWDPLFLSRKMRLTKGEIDIFLNHERNRRLLEMRRRLLSMAIEFTVYVNPDADLDARYAELATKALGVEISGTEASVWRTDPMLISRPVHHQDLMLAESIGVALHGKLVELFGEDRLSSRKPAEWIIERCFAPGENFPLQERLSRSIEGGFNFDALMKSVWTGPAPPAAK